MKVGDLIKWRDYTTDKTFVGLLIRCMPVSDSADAIETDWADIVVLCAGEELKWTSWQCEVVK